jgi:hypothetical protein
MVCLKERQCLACNYLHASAAVVIPVHEGTGEGGGRLKMTLADRKRHRTSQLVRRGVVSGEINGVYDTVRAFRPGRDSRNDAYLVYHTHVCTGGPAYPTSRNLPCGAWSGQGCLSLRREDVSLQSGNPPCLICKRRSARQAINDSRGGH